MANPRDWFRRRPVAALEDAPVLDLGEDATLLREPPPLGAGTAPRPATPSLSEAETTRPLPPNESKPAHPVTPLNDGRPHRPVPPPPPRPSVLRRDGALDRGAFALRPELVRARPVEPARLPGHGVAPAAFALRRSGQMQLAPSRPPPEAKPLAETPLAEALPSPALPSGPEARAQRDAAAGTGDGTNSDHAAFTLAAPGVSWKRARPPVAESGRMSALLRDAFTPTRPKQNASLFSGRYKQMQRVIAAIEEERAHVVIYGERGSGKTSLANVLTGRAEEAGYFVLRFACSSELSFEDIFRSFLRRMPATLLADGIGATSRAGIDNFEQLVAGHCGVPELIAAFERIHDRHVFLIVDEYDRVTAEDAKAKFAELIKNMSDAAVPVTLLLIGVAENVRELLGKHPSLQRTLVAVPMPLMARPEIDGIIAAGEEKSGLHFDPWVRQTIADLAQGLPYHAQLLGLFAARNAVRRQSSRVEREDLRYAVERAAEEAESRLKEAYDLAVGPHENASFRDVLFYAARSRSDEFGTFTAADVAVAAAAARPGPDRAEPGSSLLALQYPLKKLTEPERGAVLRRVVGPGGLRYQFSSQMMRHHVLVRQAEQRRLV